MCRLKGCYSAFVPRRSFTVKKPLVWAFALWIGTATIGLSVQMVSAAETKDSDATKKARNPDAVKKERCERNAMLHLYTGQQKTRYIQECLAREEEQEGKAAKRQPGVRPSGRAAVPRVTPLGPGNPPSTSTGSTTPSNAAVAPSAPVIGSTGTSTTGSSATSISGSSGSSTGSSGGR
jgi:hypothetical protein